MTQTQIPAEYIVSCDADAFIAAMAPGGWKDGLSTDEYLACLHADFRFFLWELWRDRGLHRVAPLDRGELDIANFASTGPKKRGVLAPRGVGKTNFGTAALTCFRLFRDVDRRVLIPSKSEGAMKEVISLVKGWLASVWFLQHLSPENALRADGQPCRNTTLYFDVAGCKENKQPSVKAIGNEGQLEGNRAHSIFPDDVETKINTKTVESRAALAALLPEYVNITYPDLPDQDDPDNELLRPVDPVEVCFFGTVKHEDTTYAKLDAKRDGQGRRVYHFRTWTLAYPTPDEVLGALELSPMLLADLASGRNKPGDPVFPKRFGYDNIAEKQAEGYTEYSMEHQQQVRLAKTNRYPLRLGDLIIMDVPRDVAPATVVWGTQDSSGSTEISDITCISMSSSDVLRRPVFMSKPDEWFPYHGTKAYIDPAGRGTDKTGLAIVSALGSLLFVKFCRGLPGGADVDSMLALIAICKEHRATDIHIEGNIDVFGTYIQSFESVIRGQFEEPGPAYPNGWKASVSEARAVSAMGFKETRIIDTLEPAFSSHRVIVCRSVIAPGPAEEPHQTLQYQISRIRKERKCLTEDGALDALAGCVYQWAHILRNDRPSINARLSESAAIDAQEAALRKLMGKDDPDGFSFLSRR